MSTIEATPLGRAVASLGRRVDLRTAGVLAVLALCALIRLKFLLSPRGFMNGDEGAAAVAAQDIVHGHLSAFFPGQAYMGTPEQYLQAGVLALLPDTGLTLRLPELAMSCATCLVIVRLAGRVGLGTWRALLAGLLFAVGPYFMLAWGSRTLGAYSATLLLGALGLLVAVDAHVSPRPLHRAALFGLLCGLGLWANPQVGYMLVPAGVWLLASWRGRWLRCAGAFATGFVLGFAPVVIYVAHHGFVPGLLGLGDPGGASSTLDARWAVLYDPVLPQFLGLRLSPNNQAVAGWFPSGLLAIAALSAAGIGVWAYRGDVRRIFTLRTESRRPLALVLVCFVLAPLLYASSPRATYPNDPRYLFGLYPVLPIGLAALTPARRWRGPAVGAGLVAATLALMLADHRVQTPQHPSASEARRVEAFLVTHGQRFAWANYWETGQLQFYAGTRVTISALVPQRFPARARAVAAAARPAYIDWAGPGTTTIEHVLQRHHVTYTRTDVGAIAIFTDLRPSLQAWQLGLGPEPGQP